MTQQLTKRILVEKIQTLSLINRTIKVKLARKSFWHFLKLQDKDSFKEERTYLLIFALALQSFYQQESVEYISPLSIHEHQNLDFSDCEFDYTIEECGDKTRFTVDLSGCDILIVEIPPRHHKSHTLILFEDWILGINTKQTIVTAAYNASLANEFSQYVRDGIAQVRLKQSDIIYSDIFPETRLKYGDKRKEKWALEGRFLSYTGAGIETGIMGRGGNLLVIDDPIKGAKEAFNENVLNRVWTSYTNSWYSRLEKPRKQILVMTPWVEGDPGDRLKTGSEESGEIVCTINFKAYSREQGMLCEDILDYRAYKILEARLDEIIFSGNYKSKRIGGQKRLYKNIKTYGPLDLPDKFDELYCYIDTADEGTDYLVAIVAGIEDGKDEHGFYCKRAYILDVYITQDGMEVTEPETAKFLADNTIQSMTVMIESNNGGRGFARNVEDILENVYKKEYNDIYIEWFHQTENKQARINSESNTVMRFCYFPANWAERWPVYYDLMNKYSREGKNEFDDPADATTGIAERINTEKTIIDMFRK